MSDSIEAPRRFQRVGLDAMRDWPPEAQRDVIIAMQALVHELDNPISTKVTDLQRYELGGLDARGIITTLSIPKTPFYNPN